MTRRQLIFSVLILISLALVIQFGIFITDSFSEKHHTLLSPNEIRLTVGDNDFLFFQDSDFWYWRGDQTQWPLVNGSFEKSRLELFLSQLLNGNMMIISRDRGYINTLNTGKEKVWTFFGNQEVSLQINVSPYNQERIQVFDIQSGILFESDLSLFPEALKGFSELLELSLTSRDSGKDLIAWKRNIMNHREYDIFISDSGSGWKNAYDDSSISEKVLAELLSAYQHWTAWAPLLTSDGKTIVTMEFHFSDGSESFFDIEEKNEEGFYPVIQKKDGIAYLCRPEDLMIFLYSNEYYY